MPHTYTSVFLEPPVSVQTRVTVGENTVFVTIRCADRDLGSWHTIDLFVPIADCATVAQAFASLAQEMSRIADELIAPSATTQEGLG